jgi:hypothetical protein
MKIYQCPECSRIYDNYEDVSFICGHKMCVDCYEDRNTPNNGFVKPTTNNLEGWEEKLDTLALLIGLHSKKCFGHLHDRDCKVLKIKQFISDLLPKEYEKGFEDGYQVAKRLTQEIRKQDMEELIEMLPKYSGESAKSTVEVITQLIKEYYSH